MASRLLKGQNHDHRKKHRIPRRLRTMEEWQWLPCRESVTVSRRPWHRLDVNALSAALQQSQLCRPECWCDHSTDELALLYDSEITLLLDSLISSKLVTIRRRPSDPWLDTECRQNKRPVRRLERIARERNTPEATLNWTTERCAYRNLLPKKCESFWKQKIGSEKSSPRQLWRFIDALMGRGGAPECDTIDAQQLHDYFDAMVAGVRSAIDGAPAPFYTQSSSDVTPMPSTSVSVDEMTTAVRAAHLIHFRHPHS